MCEVLDQLASRLEDTQVDLTPHETLGRHANGSHFPAEMAVSKTLLNRRSAYVVCLRDASERKRAELMTAGERRVFERLAANVDLRITLEAITDVVERVAPGLGLRDSHARRSRHAPESLRRTAPAGRLRARDGRRRSRRAQRLVRGSRLSAAPGHRRRHRARRALGELPRSRPRWRDCAVAGRRSFTLPTAASSARSRCISARRAARCDATSS